MEGPECVCVGGWNQMDKLHAVGVKGDADRPGELGRKRVKVLPTLAPDFRLGERLAMAT